MKTKNLAVNYFVILFANVGLVWADGTISGKVTDLYDGQPVQGAKIIATACAWTGGGSPFDDPTRPVKEAATGPKGNYKITLPAGNYIIRAAAEGYILSDGGYPAKVPDGATATRNIEVIKDPANRKPASVKFDVKVMVVKDTSAVIHWATDIPTAGRIEYGPTKDYGSVSKADEESYAHLFVHLEKLKPGTAYHFRVRAKDYYGNEFTSKDHTFTTYTRAKMDELVKAARKNRDLPKTYYVKPDGDDSKDGLTLAAAWKTLTHAVEIIEAGDTVKVQRGTYHESPAIGGLHSAKRYGIPTHPVKIVADGEVILDGQNTLKTGLVLDVRNPRREFIEIHGLTIQNYKTYGIYCSGGRSITIKDCTIRKVVKGIFVRGLGPMENMNIDHNTIYNCSSTGIDAFYKGGRLWSRIANNTIHDVNGGLQWGGRFQVVEHNHIYNIKGKGTTCGFNRYSTLRYNNMHDIRQRGNRFGTGGCRPIHVYRNTGKKSGMFFNTYPHTVVTIRENTLTASSGWGILGNYGLVENNTFINSTFFLGGGLEAPRLSGEHWGERCIFRGNLMKGRSKHSYGNFLRVNNQLNTTIANNIFVNRPGIEFSRFGGNPCKKVEVINNVFCNIIGDAVVTGRSCKLDELTVRNNIFVNVSGHCVNDVKNVIKTVKVAYNNVWKCGPPGFNNVTATNTVSKDPLFADLAKGDFHLKSKYGRWDGKEWVKDKVTSPLIDAADPSDGYSNEPKPNGGRINMGAYGNTDNASKSEVDISAGTGKK